MLDGFKLRETHGRRLLVEFTCRRCATKIMRPFDECLKEQREGFQGLYDFNPKNGWYDGGFYYPMMCSSCKAAYDEFMSNKGAKEVEVD